jgi:hypothetical protein
MTSLPTISMRPSSSPTYQPTAAPSVSLKPKNQLYCHW